MFALKLTLIGNSILNTGIVPKATVQTESPETYSIVPRPANSASDHPAEHAHGAPARLSWTRLLKRVFDIDIEHGPHCGGRPKIIAAIEDPAVIVRILKHLGLPARAAPRTPAWRVDRSQAA